MDWQTFKINYRAFYEQERVREREREIVSLCAIFFVRLILAGECEEIVSIEKEVIDAVHVISLEYTQRN